MKKLVDYMLISDITIVVVAFSLDYILNYESNCVPINTDYATINFGLFTTPCFFTDVFADYIENAPTTYHIFKHTWNVVSSNKISNSANYNCGYNMKFGIGIIV
jgi:hypothetical protein